jgi:Uma2 family endonuclease
MSGAKAARRLATWENLVATPEDGLKYEILGGSLEALPSPLPGHRLVQGVLVAELHAPFFRGRGGPGGWWILIEPDVYLRANDIVSPDLVGWRRERVPTFPATRPITDVPDWICEVLSPSNERRDRIHKAELYLTTGVHFYWIIDVGERTLEAYRSQQDAWMRLGAWTDGNKPRIAPFEAIELDVGSLFPPPDATAPDASS